MWRLVPILTLAGCQFAVGDVPLFGNGPAPDLAGAAPDLANVDLAGVDFSGVDFSVAPAPDLAMSLPVDLAAPRDLATPPPPPDLSSSPDLLPGGCLSSCGMGCIPCCTESCGGGSCTKSCGAGCPCNFACTANNCTLSCTTGAQCKLEAKDGNSATITCNTGALCDATCDNEKNSCSLDCETGARCRLHCKNGSACTFATCQGTMQTCSDGSIVCNESC